MISVLLSLFGKMSDSENDETNEMSLFVTLLADHKSLISKSQTPIMKAMKEKDLGLLKCELETNTGKPYDTKQILKRICNMKSKVKKKSDIQRTGNKRIKLLSWETDFLNVLNSDNNPVFRQLDNSFTVGLPREKADEVLATTRPKERPGVSNEHDSTRKLSNAELQVSNMFSS